VCSERSEDRILPSGKCLSFSRSAVYKHFRFRMTTPIYRTLLFGVGKGEVSDTCAGDDELFSE
jgi:hypothetical protein